MNYRAAWIVLAAVTGLFCQTSSNKAAPKADTWQKSKECAAQAEKVVADWDRDNAARGFPKTIWTNHYSPKFNRCFIEVHDAATPRSSLTDAFERSTVAVYDIVHRYCEIGLDDVDCHRVYEFIADHMNN
jgi:hypothetical protein